MPDFGSAVSQLSQTTQQNSSSSEELAATAEEMSSQAEQLQRTMSFFKTEASEQLQAARKPAAPKTSVRKQAWSRSSVNGLGSEYTPDESHFSKF